MCGKVKIVISHYLTKFELAIRYLLILILISLHFDVNSQNPFYTIDIKIDTSTLSIAVLTKLVITGDIFQDSDTLWFHLPAQSYSSTDNAFTKDQLKWGYTDFYFRKDHQLSKISDLNFSTGNVKIPYFFKDDSKEFVGISGWKNKKIKDIQITCTVKLPDMIDGFGIADGNIYLRHFFPELASFQGEWFLYPHRQYVEKMAFRSDYDVTIEPLIGHTIMTNGITKEDDSKIYITARGIKNLSINFLNNFTHKISGTFVSGKDTIPYSIIFLKKFNTVSWQDIDQRLQQVADAMTKYLGPYPYKNLILGISDPCENCFLSSGMALTKDLNTSDYSLDTYLADKLAEIWAEGLFDVNTEQHHWLYSGISFYYSDRYMTDAALINVQAAGQDFTADENAAAYNHIKYQMHTPLVTEENELDAYMIYFNRTISSSLFFQYIAQLAGKESLDKTLNSPACRTGWLSPEKLIKTSESYSTMELKPVLESFLNHSGFTDYAIQSARSYDGMLEVNIVNKDTFRLPFILSVMLNNGSSEDFLVPGFTGDKTVLAGNYNLKDVSRISVDKSGILPEINRENNHFFPNAALKHGSVRMINTFGNGSSLHRELRIFPVPAYNDNDGFMAGLTLSNYNTEDYRPLKFLVTPMYSFRQKKILGEAQLSYDYYPGKSNVKQISFLTGIKSFDLNYNQAKEYSQRYIRLNPEISIHFLHPPVSGKTSSLSFKTFVISEEYPVFDDTGNYLNLEKKGSLIWRLEYDYSKSTALNSTRFTLSGEQQTYGQQNYLKVTGILDQRYMYSSGKNIYIRAFVSGFLKNTQRSSGSYQNIFTKGSIALIHQGFNDYTYDEYFFSRQNQSGWYDNQISLESGGGFKTPVGSAYSIGMSNHLAASVNGSIDFPFKPSKIPLRVYFDIGTYSTFSDGKYVFNTMYNGGFSLHFKNVGAIHLPIIFSEDLRNIYKGQHKSFFSGISFNLNLNNVKAIVFDKPKEFN